MTLRTTIVSFLRGTAILGLLLATPACGRADEYQRIGQKRGTGVTLACIAKPQWTARTPAGGQRSEKPDRLRIYLDISEPMAGFLPMPPSGEAFGFKNLVLSLPGRLTTAVGTTGHRIEWKTFGEGVSAPRAAPRVERALFSSAETRLDLALRDAVEDLSSGRLETAVVVTDLIATGEVTGAAGTAKPLIDWLASEPVRSGRFHVGLLGVRAPYWGVLAKTCRPARPDLGCWFSERAPGYKPLPQRALVPFYLLILGRDAAAIERLGTSLAADAAQRKLGNQWELLTTGSRPLPARLECTAHKPGDEESRQYALFRSPEGQLRCRRDERVEMSCRLFSDLGITVSSASPSGLWPEVRIKTTGTGVSLEIDCERVKDRKTATTDLKLILAGGRGSVDVKLWQGWSSDTDEEVASLDKTLDLEQFLDRVRLAPARWEIDCEPLFRGGSRLGT